MTAPSLDFAPKGLYIGGGWVAPQLGKTFATINPSTGEKLAEIPDSSEADVDRACRAAKSAFGAWRRTPIKERARCLELLAARILEHKEELALIDAVDSGNAIAGMRGDMVWTADSLTILPASSPRSRARHSRRGRVISTSPGASPTASSPRSTPSIIRSDSVRKRPRRRSPPAIAW